MKKIFLSLLFLSSLSYSQNEDRFGLSLSVNEYYGDSNFLFTKSGIGYGFGVQATVPITDDSEILTEFNFNRYNFKLMGRKDLDSERDWINFNLYRMGISVLYDYDVLSLMKDDLTIGLCAGPSLQLLSYMTPAKESDNHYLLDPYDVEAGDLSIDDESDSLLLSPFAAFGFSARYLSLQATFTYNIGFSNPYRKLASNYKTLDGQDKFASINFTYYFGDDY